MTVQVIAEQNMKLDQVISAAALGGPVHPSGVAPALITSGASAEAYGGLATLMRTPRAPRSTPKASRRPMA